MKSLVTLEVVIHKLKSFVSGKNNPKGVRRPIGLALILNQVAKVLKQARQAMLHAFATALRKRITTGNPRPLLMQRLSDRIASPSEQRLGLALSQIERSESVGDIATSRCALGH